MTENLTGDIIINSPTIWLDRDILLSGNIIITHGGSLTLQGTLLTMNCITELQYEIYIEANGLLKLEKSPNTQLRSTITAAVKTTDSMNMSDYLTSKNTRIVLRSNILYPSERPTIQADDSTFSFMGSSYIISGKVSMPGWYDGSAIILRSTSGLSYINNSTFNHCIGCIAINSGTYINCSNNNFNNIGSMNPNIYNNPNTGIAVFWVNGQPSIAYGDINIINSTMNNIQTSGTRDCMPFYIYDFSNYRNTNYHFIIDGVNISNINKNAQHQFDIYAIADNIIIRNWNNITPDGRGMVFNNNASTSLTKNALVENVTYYGGWAITWTLNNISNIIRNIKVNPTIPSTSSGLFLDTSASGQGLVNSLVENCKWYGRGDMSVLRIKPINSTLRNFNIGDSSSTCGRSIFWLIHESSGYLPTTGNIFENIRVTGSSGSAGYGMPASVCQMNYCNNNIFRDFDVTATNTAYTIWIDTQSNNNFWININDKGKTGVLAGSKFEKYWYLDILVNDINGIPIPNASITITNEQGYSGYPSVINRNGITKSVFTTKIDGHTYLPIENDAETPCIMQYIQDGTTQTNLTYRIEATYNGITSVKTGVTPNDTWFRNAEIYEDATTTEQRDIYPLGTITQTIVIDTTTPTGTLNITTTPVLGDIYIDYNLYGNGTVSTLIPAGNHTVSFGVVSSYITPLPQDILLLENQTLNVIGIYTEETCPIPECAFIITPL